MKKLTGIIVGGLMALTSFAQQSLYEAAEAYNGIEFKEYYSVTKDENGKNVFSGQRWIGTVSIAKNRFGKPVGIEVTETETGKKRITYSSRNDFADHYTMPAYTRGYGESASAIMIIDGVIFELSKTNEDMTKFKIDGVWVAKSSDEGTEETSEDGKKMSLKEKAKAMKEKAQTAMNGGEKLSSLKETDLEQMIRDYVAAMKKIQQANPLSSEEKAEVAAMKFSNDSLTAAINAKNDAYWTSEEGQKKLAEMNKASTFLVNDLGGPVWICYGQGVSTELEPGEKIEFHYSTGGNVYKGTQRPNTQQADYEFSDLMLNTRDYSGKTVNISSVMPK